MEITLLLMRKNAREIRFSPNEKYITMGYDKPAPTRTILLINGKNGEILWEYEIEQSFGRVSNLMVSNEGDVVATFAKEGLYVFDRSGKIVHRKTFPRENLVTAGLSTNGNQVGISVSQRVEIMKIKTNGK